MTPKDGTTKKRKGVKAKTLKRWVNWYPDNGALSDLFIFKKDAVQDGWGSLYLATPVFYTLPVTIQLPATGIIKKARKSAPIDRSKFDCDND